MCKNKIHVRAHTYTKERTHAYTRKKEKHIHTDTDTRDTWTTTTVSRATDPCSSLGIVHYGASFILSPLISKIHATSNVYLFRDVIPVLPYCIHVTIKM